MPRSGRNCKLCCGPEMSVDVVQAHAASAHTDSNDTVRPLPEWWVLAPLQLQLFAGGSQPGFGFGADKPLETKIHVGGTSTPVGDCPRGLIE